MEVPVSSPVRDFYVVHGVIDGEWHWYITAIKGNKAVSLPARFLTEQEVREELDRLKVGEMSNHTIAP